MRNHNCNYFKRLVLMAVFAVMAMAGHAQLLRTSYFMEGAHYRLQLNPALAPPRGYINLPGVGNASAAFHSNAIEFNDVLDVMKNAKSANYFVADEFMNKLKDMNKASAQAATDIISTGWWHGLDFWSVNLSVKVNGSGKVPKEMFNYLRDMKGLNNNDYTDYVRYIGDEEVNLNAYTELGVGYSHQFNDRLSVGGRFKGLLGLGNARLKVREGVARINMTGVPPDLDWSTVNPFDMLHVRGTVDIDVVADLETSFEGLELLYNDKDYIDDIKFDIGKSGVSGVGAAFDVGVSYRATDALTLSASIIDLGFIRWAKGCSQVAHSNTQDLHFDTHSPYNYRIFKDIIGAGDVFNPDLLRLTIDEGGAKARTTAIGATVVAGAEYALTGDKVRLGALYTHHNTACDGLDEVTLSVNMRPSSIVDVAVSYSPLLCGGKSAGLAFKVGPLFVGTDYIYTGKKSRCFNALAGISIPLGGKQPSEKEESQ